MLQKFRKHILENLSFLNEKKLLVAISGGIDSVVLTYLLYKLDFNCSLAHCNFRLRGNESDLDEQFVICLGEKLNIKTYTTQFDTQNFSEEHKLSTQLAARKLRYDWFNKLTSKHKIDYILTAHHADDNLETFLINLTRGTGLKGLRGIPEQNNNIIRPLLNFSRDEILNYAKKNNISWREDASNSEKKYLRNKIRLGILPKLKEINPNLLDNFSKTLQNLDESQQIIEDRINEISKDILHTENSIIKLDIKKIEKLSNSKAYLYALLNQFGFTEWNDVNNLLTAQSGKKTISKTHILLKNRDFLLISPIHKISNEKQYEISEDTNSINIPIPLEFSNLFKTETKNIITIDKNLVEYPLILRKKETGDFFYPTGMTGKKKLSKFFKDEKLSVFDKENIWILCSNTNEIIWVIGLRKDRRFLATKKTKNTITIEFKDSSQ